MPVYVAQIVQKGTVRDATACHDGNLVSVACHRAPLAAQPLATRAWKGPQSDTLVDVLEHGHGEVACHGKRPAAVVVLSHPGACRSPGLVGTRGAPRQVPWNALDGLPGKRLLPGPWDASDGLPGKLLLPGSCLEYFVLEWSSEGPRGILAVTWQALPRDAATARAQVRGTRVPLF